MPDNDIPARRIAVFDATLRDGEQAPGNSIDPAGKVAYALMAEQLGVDVIEVGFPGSSPTDVESTRRVAQVLTTARFSTFNRSSRRDIDVSVGAGGVGSNHQIAICGTGSDLHLRFKRQITKSQAVAEGTDAVAYAVSLGVRDVAFCVEDASRGEIGFIQELTSAAVEAGATTIGMADTTGCASPREYGDLFAAARDWLPDHVVLSTHCHDDLGLSLANALAGVQAGAGEVQATLGGIGERAGNTALEELATFLAFKGDRLGLTCDVRLERLFDTYALLSGLIGLTPTRTKAVFGTNAFATEAGIHQDGLLKNPATYEFIDPTRFGRERSMLVGRHSGRSILRHILSRVGVPEDDDLLEELYDEFVLSCAPGDVEDVRDVERTIFARLLEPVHQ